MTVTFSPIPPVDACPPVDFRPPVDICPAVDICPPVDIPAPGPASAISDTVPGAILTSLLHLVAEGQQRPFADLYQLTAARVFGLTWAVLRDSSNAEEVTQEVYLEIWQTAKAFDRSKGSASAWIMRLAHSRAVDRVRRVQAARMRDDKYARLDYQPEVDTVLDIVTHAQDQEFMREQLRTGMARLTPLQREALVLTFFQGMTGPAASRMLDIPLSTLKSRLRSGLIVMRASRVATG